ncbi:MAG: T9SS type A sorting domain-containing protein [Chitinophagaceae bacterium]
MKAFTSKGIFALSMFVLLTTTKLSAQAPRTVTISPSTTQNINVGGTVNFTATRNSNNSFWAGGNSNFSYTWSSSPAGVTFTNNPGSGGSSSSTVATFPSSGTFLITCFVQEGGGGGNATSPATTVIVTVPTPSLTLTPSTSQSILTGGLVSFTATSADFAGSGNITFTWSAPGATIGTNPTTGNPSSTKSITFPTAGTYTVSVNAVRSTSNVTSSTTTVRVFDVPASPSLWATSSDGNQVSSFTVVNGIYISGPTNIFDPFPSSTETTAALGRNDKPTQSLGHFYWLPNTGTNGVVNVYAATSTGTSRTLIGTLDVNGVSSNSLGFVRLAMGPDGTGWILAGDGTTLYLAKFMSNGVNPVTITVEDASVSLVGGAASTFQNGDICVSGNGTLFALANDGSGVTQIFTGFPTGSSTTLTKKWDLIDNTSAAFSGRVNGVAFDLLGSLYISTDNGLYFIDQNTVNGPVGTVGCFLVQAVTGLQDLASNVFPSQTTLPVNLGIFNVTKQGSNAVLDWKTLTEINSDHFEIERSYDGINFQVIGTRQAAGSSIDSKTYQFIDPITINTGIIYYRLKTLDIDSRTSISKIVALRISGGPVKEFSVYPNPFINDLKVQISSEKDNYASIRISNASGQLVISKKIMLQKGENVVVLSSELTNLKPGMHLMEIITENGKMTQKIIKR